MVETQTTGKFLELYIKCVSACAKNYKQRNFEMTRIDIGHDNLQHGSLRYVYTGTIMHGLRER